MKKLAQKFPDIAWRICVAQFGNHHQVGHYSHKPRWRPDGYGFGEPFPTWGPIIEFTREMVETALTWKDHSPGMLSDLVERLHDLRDEDQTRVWALVEAWAKTKASDTDKAAPPAGIPAPAGRTSCGNSAGWSRSSPPLSHHGSHNDAK